MRYALCFPIPGVEAMYDIIPLQVSSYCMP